MYNKKMAKIIEKATKLNIKNIETKDGYAGADVLMISSNNENHIKILKSFMSLETNDVKIIREESTIYNELETDLYKLFGVFSSDKIDNDYYQLKTS